MLKLLLTQARDLIADPNHWTQHTFARRSPGGDPCTAEEGTCWCARGAVRKVAGVHHERELVDILTKAANRLALGNGIVDVNDFVGHAEVIQVFDYAIENVQE